MVVFSRMQVSTSCSGRRAGWWYSTSLVASSGTRAVTAIRCSRARRRLSSPRYNRLAASHTPSARLRCNCSRICEGFFCLEAMRQRQHQQLTFGKFQEIIEPQMAFALFGLVGIVAALAAGEQLA